MPKSIAERLPKDFMQAISEGGPLKKTYFTVQTSTYTRDQCCAIIETLQILKDLLPELAAP